MALDKKERKETLQIESTGALLGVTNFHLEQPHTKSRPINKHVYKSTKFGKPS
jgi:hypothetical protein